MDIIIGFFRDTLVGPFYITWVVVFIILIFACIGYLAEKGITKKKEKEKYAIIEDNVNNVTNEPVNDVTSSNQRINNTPITEPTVNTDINNVIDSTPIVNQVVPNVVGEVVPSVTTVVTPPSQSSDNKEQETNIVIPTINQDGNETI